MSGGFEYRLLTKAIDARALMTMKREDLIDVVLTSHWETHKRAAPNLLRFEEAGYQYLIGKDADDEGYFLIWNNGGPVGALDLDSYKIVSNEAKKAGLKPPFHIYARYEDFQSPNVRFWKIPDKILAHFGLDENEAYNDDLEDEAAYSLGWPLATLVIGLVAVWIAGMIALPLATMVERAFVFQDRADDLTVMGTRINRLTRDVATIELDVKMLEREAANAATEEAASDSGFPVPSISGPSALAPTLTPSITPTPSASGTISELGPKDIIAEIASLRARKREIANDIVTLKREEERLQIEKANAPRYSLQNFSTISPIHAEVFFSTLGYASLVTVLAFLICYPVAYAAATTKTANKLALLLLLLVIPYAINELLRTFAWAMILEREGVLNTLLSALGLFAPGEGPRWVASNGAVFTVMIYTYLLFMVFPLYNTLDTLDKNQVEAARDLGASAWQLHTRVVIPHAKPGIAMGAIMVFMLSAGSIAVPDVIGRGMHPDWFTQIIYRRFFESANWNQGSAYSLMLLGACIVFVLTVMAAFRVNIRDVAR